MSQSSQIDEVLDQNLPREENNDTDNEEESDENDEIPDEYEINSGMEYLIQSLLLSKTLGG